MAMDFDAKRRKVILDIYKCKDEKVGSLVRYIRSFVRKKGNGKEPLILIDHIRAITPDDKRVDAGSQAANITRALKAAAEESGCAIVLLNQRNSAGNQRPNPRPTKADLYGGEPAFVDYDAVFYLYRFKKWFESRMGQAATDSEKDKIRKIFPEVVVNGEMDLAEIGALKARFGSEYERRQLVFDAPLTRFRPVRERAEELL
jgi:replicative DNA helicase